MPPKRGRRSYEPEARDDMYTSSEEDGDAAWEPKGRRGRRASTSKPRKRSRSVGPSTETVSASPLLGTITPKRNRSRSATPGSSTIRRGPLPFERLPLPLPPLPQQLEARRLVLFGSNSLGQLGLGTHALKAGLPPLVQPERHPWFEAVANQAGSSTSEWSIEAAACGSYHTLVLTKFGSILSWGVNELGAIGRNTEATPDGQSTEELETQPLPVELSSPNFRPTRIACGDSFSLAVSDAGELRFWGSIRSSDGLLSATPNSKSRITKLPSPIADAPREPVVAVATGCDHAILLTAEGHIYTFGNGQQGQLGRKVIERRKHHGLVPEKLALGRKSIAIGAGTYTSFAVSRTGAVFAWGLNQFRQCGATEKDGGWLDILTMPTEVKGLHPSKHGGARVSSIVGGEHHTLFLFENGEVWGCGRCDGGELGLGEGHPAVRKQLDINPEAEPEAEGEAPRQLVCEPVQIKILPDERVVAISCRARVSFARTADGRVFAFGFSKDHALGSEELLTQPTQISAPSMTGLKVAAVSAGLKHTVVLAAPISIE